MNLCTRKLFTWPLPSSCAAAALATLCAASPLWAQQATAPRPAPKHWQWAQKPPMGWNSWDAFATTVTEAQVRAQADYMAQKLAKHGWQYVVADIQWYEPAATGFQYRAGAALTMDSNGRLQPAPNKFPSASGGVGFKALADYAHSKGLKFGVHLMRGIPRQAVAQDVPILGTNVTASQIADKGSTCEWNSDMYGVDMAKPGAQEYYDSVFAQFAAWGLDFVKVDDLSRPYHGAEVEGIRRAIDKTGRPMVLSTSPGETPLAEGEHVVQNANMWRMSDDFWDTWPALFEQFERTRKWAPHIAPGHFPDADMLPLGAIRQVPGYGGPAWTRFTRDEQLTMVSLWCIARSPLMMGGDMTRNDAWTESLLTNPEAIAVNQASSGNRQLFNRDGLIGWVADVPRSPDKYLALFNTRGADAFDEARALYRSPLVTRQTPGQGVAVDVGIKGARKLYLVVDDGGDGFNADHADWVEPRLVGPAGVLKLSELRWKSATAGWGQPSATVAASGQPMSVAGKKVAHGIGTHSKSVIEFDLPEGYTLLRATAALDDGGTAQAMGATARFLVFTSSPYAAARGEKVAAPLGELGFSGAALVRDLWQRKDVGRFTGEFAPSIASHGAGLYRVSRAR